jgi:hypothetical protein
MQVSAEVRWFHLGACLLTPNRNPIELFEPAR